MTLLQKLNLEPGAVSTLENRATIMLNLPGQTPAYFEMLRIGLNESVTKTNAEFLAACEEWLSKN
jgi:hypothetical protein